MLQDLALILLSFFHPYFFFCSFPLSTPSLPLVSQEKNLEWFPRMRAMSLVSSEGDSEQNEMRCLQEKLENTITLVALLSGQLAELKEQVRLGAAVTCSSATNTSWTDLGCQLISNIFS